MAVYDNFIIKELSLDQYYQDIYDKTQIYIHHTAGNTNPAAVVADWESNVDHVGTAYIIGGKPPQGKKSSWKDGDIVQCFDPKFWCHHLGIKTSSLPKGSKSNLDLNRHSIAIEVCNWGYLTKTDVGFKTYVGTILPESEVIEIPMWRDYTYWHAYTDAQLASLQELLTWLCEDWKITGEFKGKEIFDLDMRAFSGEPGIFNHASVRKDKTDMYPHPKLIEVLQNI